VAVEKRLTMVKLYSHGDIEIVTRPPAAPEPILSPRRRERQEERIAVLLTLAILASLREA
jgi:hypothetical protein